MKNDEKFHDYLHWIEVIENEYNNTQTIDYKMYSKLLADLNNIEKKINENQLSNPLINGKKKTK